MRPDRFRGVVGAQRAVPSARQGAADQRHAAHRERAILSALLPGARSGRGGIRARSAPDHPQHAVRRVGRRRWPPPARPRQAVGAPPSLGMVPKGGGFLQGPARRRPCRPGSPRATSISMAPSSSAPASAARLNYYRNLDRNWEMQGVTGRRAVTVPALYVAGDRDFVVVLPRHGPAPRQSQTFVPGLRGIQMLPGCGHWTQQERPNEVNAAIIDFIRACRAAPSEQNADIPTSPRRPEIKRRRSNRWRCSPARCCRRSWRLALPTVVSCWSCRRLSGWRSFTSSASWGQTPWPASAWCFPSSC